MKKSVRIQILISAIAVVALLVFGPRVLLLEPSFTPLWSTSIDESGKGSPGAKSIVLHLQKSLLVADSIGNYKLFPVSGVANAGFGMVSDVNQNKTETVIRTLEGKPIFTLNDRRGFPLFFEKSVLLFDPTALSFSRYSLSGEFQFDWQSDTPIVGIEAFPNDTFMVMGLDGDLDAIDKAGKTIGHYKTPQLGVIIGFAKVSDNKIAIVSRSTSEHLFVIEYTNGSFKQLWDRPLSGTYNRDLLLTDLGSAERFAVEEPGGILVLSTDQSFAEFVPINGWVKSVKPLAQAKTFVIIREASDGNFVELFSQSGKKVAGYGPAKSIQDLAVIDNKLIVAGNEGLLCFEFSER